MGIKNGKDDAILVATYNRTLIAYMAYLYDKLDNKETAALKSLFAAPRDKVDIRTVDSLMYAYFQDYLRHNRLRYQIGLPKTTSYEIISEGISKLKKQHPSVNILNQKNTVFLLDEIQWIKDCLYLEEEEYQSIDRVGKVKAQQENLPRRLAKNSKTRKAVFELMRFYDQALRERGSISFSDMRILAMVGRSSSMSKNFRTTTQISQAAYSLIQECPEIIEGENFVKPSLIDKQGQYPVIKSFPDETAQAEFVSREISQLLKICPAKDIAVIARFKSQLECVKGVLESNGLTCQFFTQKETTFDSASIKLISMHSIKGLEFRVVFIIGLDRRVLPYYSKTDAESRLEEELKERKLRYVGMTRATETLYLLSSAPPSKFLNDINPKYLRVDGNCRISRFYNISTADYRFRDKVPNIHTTEEEIRMGDNILLIAENPKYDPIMLDEEQVAILGIAVGLVKQKS